MDTPTDTLDITVDRPIETSSQDRLEREKYSAALAETILEGRNQESLVISLTGPWGCGKTSIKNLVVEKLEDTKRSNVIEFNPWEWGTQEKLTSLFFDEMSRAIKRKDLGKETKRLAKAFHRYAARLGTTVQVLDNTLKYSTLLLGSALFASTVATRFDEGLLKTVLTYFSYFSMAASALSPYLGKIAAFLKGKGDDLESKAKDNEASLSDIKADINRLLAKQEKPLVIIMDDIDRLSPEQTRTLFQLVKSNMSFPNVVFLLIYDRNIVENSLGHFGYRKDYLDKIVQFNLSAPAIRKNRLNVMLAEKFNAILASERQLYERFDHNLWNSAFTNSIAPFFSNLRDIHRYTATLSFHCKLIRGQNVAEVNTVDVFVLECLRMFAPDAYAHIARSKHVLTQTLKDAEAAAALEAIVKHAPDTLQHAVGSAAGLLFPHICKDYRSSFSKFDSRVSNPDAFDRYFEFSVSDQEVSNSMVQEAIGIVDDSERFCTLVRTLNAAQQKVLFEQMSIKIDRHSSRRAEPILTALLDAGECLAPDDTATPEKSAVRALAKLLLQYLHYHTEQVRAQLLLSALDGSDALVTLTELFAVNGERESLSAIVGAETAREMETRYVDKALRKANQHPEAFLQHWRFQPCIRQLNKVDSSGSTWLATQIDSLERFFLFAKAMVKTQVHVPHGIERTFFIVDKYKIWELLEKDACQAFIQQIEKHRPHWLKDPLFASFKDELA